MKLTYWIAVCNDDAHCYSIRAKTKHEVVALRSQTHNPEGYDKPKKVTIEYIDGFDLMDLCSTETGMGWEYSRN